MADLFPSTASSRDPVGNVVVTGASAGVGRAVALAFARRGWSLALLARDVEALQATCREAEAAGAPRALALPADVADAEAVFAAADRAATALGTIDVWVNNAMATVFAPVSDLSPEEFRRVTEVTYLGQVHGTMAALRHMRPRNAGTIVQVGSALSYRAIPLQSAYCGAKFAVRGFTDALRTELLHERSKIRLTMVQLPAVNTPQFDWARSHMPRQAQPVPPIHQPEPIAEAILRAALHPRRETWIGWPTLQAILGNMLAPSYADRYLARNGVSTQLTNEPVQHGRPDNLMIPVDGMHRTHGRFDDRASGSVQSFSPLLFRLAAGAAALAVPAIAWALGRRTGQRHPR